jgi:hypothetical protein
MPWGGDALAVSPDAKRGTVARGAVWGASEGGGAGIEDDEEEEEVR